MGLFPHSNLFEDKDAQTSVPEAPAEQAAASEPEAAPDTPEVPSPALAQKDAGEAAAPSGPVPEPIVFGGSAEEAETQEAVTKAAPVKTEAERKAEESKAQLLDAFARTETAFRHFSDQFDMFQFRQSELIDRMYDISRYLPSIAEEFPKLQNAVNGVQWDRGLEHLCRLHRDLVLRKDRSEALDDVADRLERILVQDFGMVAIRPSRGEIFNAEKEMRIHDEMPATGQVARCVANGWMLRNQALLRALVETIFFDFEGGDF